MSRKDALETLQIAIRDQLINQPIWDDRVFPDVAPSNEVRPLIVFNAFGNESNRLAVEAPNFTLDVKAKVQPDGDIDAPGVAMQAAALIYELLDDQGEQDGGIIIGDSEWIIKTITKTTRIHIIDDFTKVGEFIYNSGHSFIIEMEAI